MTITPTPTLPSTMNSLPIVLISVLASTGVAALISGIFLVGNDLLRRKSEEKRFKLELALKIASLREKQFMEWIEHHPQNSMILPSIIELFRMHLEEIKEQWKK